MCSSIWQVPQLHRRPPWYWRLPLHVLPLLHLRPNRKMPRADNPAVSTPHCGVDELCGCSSCSQKGDNAYDFGGVVIWTEFIDLWLAMHLTLSSSWQVFISIKGIYYQAEVMGQLTTWLVPYQFSHDVSAEWWNVLHSNYAINNHPNNLLFLHVVGFV